MWAQTPDSEKLKMWKQLRTQIAQLDDHVKLDTVAQFFSKLPIGHRSIDYYTPRDWPTPWEMIYSGMTCPSAVSVLIYHTLSLCGFDARIKLYLIDDSYDTYLLPVIDDAVVLNYEPREVTQLDTIRGQITILKVFDQTELTTIS